MTVINTAVAPYAKPAPEMFPTYYIIDSIRVYDKIAPQADASK